MADRRKTLSKKQRFNIFKRDLFVCQYCGRTPPSVVLEVDHITAVSRGGTNDGHNLITACFDCNQGKSDGTLEGVPLNTKERSELLEERLDQAKAYDHLLRKQRERQDEAVNAVIAVYGAYFEGWTLRQKTRISIRMFLERLSPLQVSDAMEIACARTDSENAFRYFCGICWNKIRQAEGRE